MKRRTQTSIQEKKELDGNIEKMISTGSTLLDLAISGGRVRGGGIPAGVLVEIFGPSASGKTVMLSEIAGYVQRQKGEIMFHDPEARLNKQFVKLFDLDPDSMEYKMSNTVTEVFESVRSWKPKNTDIVNGIFADSLAALSTDTELKDGDKMGMRRAKEFSEQLRVTCRELKQKNYIMVASNQVRENVDAGAYAQKYATPGGVSVGFYASVRLRALSPEKIFQTEKIAGKDIKRVVGVNTTFEVYKNSVWKPYRSAPVIILFDYGIDDIQANLQFIKTYKGHSVYCLNEKSLSNSMEKAISIIETNELVDELKNEVINLWEDIESKFVNERKPKLR